MSSGHCSATKETHGIIRYRFLLQEQSHNEDPSLDILNAQRRKTAAPKDINPTPHSPTLQGSRASAEAPQVYHVQVPTARLDLSRDVRPLGNMSKESKLVSC